MAAANPGPVSVGTGAGRIVLATMPFSPAAFPALGLSLLKPLLSRAGFDVTVERFWTKHHHVVRREVVAQEHRAPRPKLVRIAPPPAPITPAPATTATDPLADLLLDGPVASDAPAE